MIHIFDNASRLIWKVTDFEGHVCGGWVGMGCSIEFSIINFKKLEAMHLRIIRCDNDKQRQEKEVVFDTSSYSSLREDE